MTLFDADFLRRLEYLSLVSRRVFSGQILAQRMAWQLGGGIEFADHRAYTAGDDFRHLDWNLYARHKQLLLKRFREEEDLHVYLLLDCSKSMSFGTPLKFDLARQVVAALAYIALANLDRVEVIAYSNQVADDFPLTRGKARILGLLRFLERLTVSGSETDLVSAVSTLVHHGRKRGLVVVVSDLYDPAGFHRGLDMLRHRKYEPAVIHIYDREEAEPNCLGDLELWDSERGLSRRVTVNERILKRYRESYQRFLQSVRRYCSEFNVACVQTDTETPFDDLVLKMMRPSVTK